MVTMLICYMIVLSCHDRLKKDFQKPLDSDGVSTHARGFVSHYKRIRKMSLKIIVFIPREIFMTENTMNT